MEGYTSVTNSAVPDAEPCAHTAVRSPRHASAGALGAPYEYRVTAAEPLPYSPVTRTHEKPAPTE